MVLSSLLLRRRHAGALRHVGRLCKERHYWKFVNLDSICDDIFRISADSVCLHGRRCAPRYPVPNNCEKYWIYERFEAFMMVVSPSAKFGKIAARARWRKREGRQYLHNVTFCRFMLVPAATRGGCTSTATRPGMGCRDGLKAEFGADGRPVLIEHRRWRRREFGSVDPDGGSGQPEFAAIAKLA